MLEGKNIWKGANFPVPTDRHKGRYKRLFPSSTLSPQI